MTILVGAIHGGHIYMGTDSLVTWSDNFTRDSRRSKFLDVGCNNLILASAGQERYSQLLTKILKSDPMLASISNRYDIEEIMDSLFKATRDFGVGEAENNQLPEHDFELMLATSHIGTIWTIDSDYSISEFDDYVCMGSGAGLGESSMKALYKSGIRGEEAIITTIETVNELHPYCGGSVFIKALELNKVDLHKKDILDG